MAATGIDVLEEIGDLRHPLQYQAGTITGRDDRGKPLKSFATAATVWGSVRQLTAREAINADRLRITSTHKIVTRYFGPASAAGRFLFGSRVFQIDSVNNVNELNVAYEFMATEVGNPA